MGSGERRSARTALGRQSGIAESIADISRRTAEESMPWTTIAGNYYKDILKGGDALVKAVAPKLQAVTRQFGKARSAAKEMPLGGSRDRALRELRLGEASTKSGIMSGGIEDAIASLANMGKGGTATAIGGFGTSAGTFGDVAGAYSNLASGKLNALGGAASGGGAAAAAAI